MVAIDEGVPGILRRIAGIFPPETPPIYRAPNTAIPTAGSIPKVTGKSNINARVAVKPGIAPKIKPKKSAP